MPNAIWRLKGARATVTMGDSKEKADFSSLDEAAWKAQDLADEREIARLLEQSQDNTGGGGLHLDDTPFDQTNKADDAEDFEDISDDDLPDEEPGAGTSGEIPALTDDAGTSHDADDADDLFGDGPSSPMDPMLDADSPGVQVHDTDDTQPNDAALSFSLNFDPEPHFYRSANQDPDIPAPA